MNRKEEMIEMRENRMSLQAIGDRFGISRERVRQIIGNTGHTAYPAYTPELIEETIALRQQGVSASEIGERIGRGTEAARRILHANNIPVRTTNRVRLAEGKRKCVQCHEVKDLSEFGKMNTDPLGTNPRCKECGRASSRQTVSEKQMKYNFDVQTVSIEQANALREVVAERERQDARWGKSNHPVLLWQPILLEEFGKVAQEVNRYTHDSKDLSDYRKELVQVAAVALAMLECLERNGR